MKKVYIKPEMKIVKIDITDIIATSTQSNAFGISEGTGYEQENW